MRRTSDPVIRDLIFLAVFGLGFCVVLIGSGSLASWDEAYYARISKNMYLTGDWIHPRNFDGPVHDKPPLYFWITALFYHLFGVNEFSTRLFSALSGVATVVVVYFLGKMLFGRLTGLLGAGILLSSTDFLHYARWGVLDVVNLFFFTAAVYAFLRARKQPKAYLWFWLAVAGAIMTKGLLIALAFGILFLHALWIRDLGFLRARLFWWGILLMLLLIFPWHAVAYAADPDLFWSNFLRKHYFLRTFVGTEGHIGHTYFYIRALINKFHPWVVGLLASIPLILFYAFRRNLANEKPLDGFSAFAWQASSRLLVIWIALVLGFFTFLVKTKLNWYILPCYPALALSIAWCLVRWTRGRTSAWMKPLVALVLVLHIPFSSVFIQDYSSGIKAVSADVRRLVEPGRDIFLYKYGEQPAAEFYCERRVRYIEKEADFAEMEPAEKTTVMIVPVNRYETERDVFEARDFGLVRRTVGLRDDVVLLVHPSRTARQ